ncbi:uncharacterized protein M6B38_249540 [Iris pallida]|uniref:WPP domain-containing protein n=1 Tax=Iris pallida TaxID=29817 RepID=A0AAX6FVL6_IRIPA|nr:uncharacterized protein M6B38_396995 [Iris pallida]KAJ6853527.1 uncharacterized protein M6B38_249540 [Iris pallida]
MADDSTEVESVENPQPNPSSDEKSAPPLPLPPSSSMASLSLGIWPPSQRTREAVTQRLVEMVSSSSVLTKRYGVLPADEAASAARSIEAAAFAAASAAAGEDGNSSSSIDGGLEILEKYSKEISARMLESVKSRNPKPDPGSEPKPADSEKVKVEDAGS